MVEVDQLEVVWGRTESVPSHCGSERNLVERVKVTVLSELSGDGPSLEGTDMMLCTALLGKAVDNSPARMGQYLYLLLHLATED